MSEPIISIVIPCYNHGEFLEETLTSIITSTNKYTPEIIIVNDGSTDLKTLEVFEKLESKGYYILNQENQGLAKARNNGISLAKGKYILPLDSDNNICPPYLNEAIEMLENTNVDIVYGDALYFGEKNGVWKNNNLEIRKILITNHIDACALFKKETWKKVGGYSEDMPYMGCEDWNFWLKCINNGSIFYYLDKICFEYRVLSTSMINSVPIDFVEKITIYNINQLYALYANHWKEDRTLINNIFNGTLIKKLVKLTLNHFNKYNYTK